MTDGPLFSAPQPPDAAPVAPLDIAGLLFCGRRSKSGSLAMLAAIRPRLIAREQLAGLVRRLGSSSQYTKTTAQSCSTIASWRRCVIRYRTEYRSTGRPTK